MTMTMEMQLGLLMIVVGFVIFAVLILVIR
jgi:hypothetical protein